MRIINRIKQAIRPEYKRSYSQSGEDIIVAGLMKFFHISKVRYLDIGAYDPKRLSNTYFFYENGHSGVCIEPNPNLFSNIKKARPRDICLNIGIGDGKKNESTFYVLNPPTLSTFSKEEADKMVREKSATLVETRRMRLESINSIIEKNFEGTPDFISLDVEGLDAEILKSFDFERFRPKVFCIETISYSKDNSGKKDMEIFDIMTKNGYKVYADTHVNTIFIEDKHD